VVGWYQWEEGGGSRRVQKDKMVQKKYTHVCKCKLIPAETISGMGGERDKGEWSRGSTQVGYI
jgi:hypothetical protein